MKNYLPGWAALGMSFAYYVSLKPMERKEAAMKSVSSWIIFLFVGCLSMTVGCGVEDTYDADLLDGTKADSMDNQAWDISISSTRKIRATSGLGTIYIEFPQNLGDETHIHVEDRNGRGIKDETLRDKVLQSFYTSVASQNLTQEKLEAKAAEVDKAVKSGDLGEFSLWYKEGGGSEMLFKVGVAALLTGLAARYTGVKGAGTVVNVALYIGYLDGLLLMLLEYNTVENWYPLGVCTKKNGCLEDVKGFDPLFALMM